MAVLSAKEVQLNAIEAALSGTILAGRVHHLRQTESTNTLALAAAQQGAEAGVWIADEQTAGRGRGGHTWHSSRGDGLYVSVLLRPRLTGVDILKLSLAAGLACRAAIARAAGVEADLRWPNDLMLFDHAGRDRKFGGILTEASIDGGEGTLSHAVVGIGINLNHPELPPELRDIATSVRLMTGWEIRREDVLAALLPALLDEVANVEAEAAGAPTAAPLAGRFEAASTWVRDLAVHVDEGGGYTGVTRGLDPHGLLQVETADELRLVRHGGVRRLDRR